MKRHLLCLCLSMAAGFAVRAAETADANDGRLRDALRVATLQLRAAETERANLQTAQTTLLDENKTLGEKFEALRKRAVAERAADEKVMATLKAEAAQGQEEISRLKESLVKTGTELKQTSAVASAKEAECARLAAAVVTLSQQLEDRERKNLALYQIAREILGRYEKFSLGEALAAREPFVGATRTKLENLVQDYQDKLTGQRVKP